MTTGTRLARWSAAATVLLTLSVFPLTAAAAGPQTNSLGLENLTKPMNIHVNLNLRNVAELKALMAQIQDKNSPMYHKYLTKEEFAARFAPTAADAKKVADYLKSQGLTVTYVSKHNLTVSATGTVQKMERTFATQIERVQMGKDVANRPMRTPAVPAELSLLVKNISGLQTFKARSFAKPMIDPHTKLAVAPVKFSKTQPNGAFYPGNCFSVTNTVYNVVSGKQQGTYSGNGYPNAACGYSPAQVQHAYGFDQVYSHGYDGTGETIAIVDAYGSPSILADANVFSSFYGLPALTSTNFSIINNPTGATPDCVEAPGNLCGWEYETTLDVEWAHAMAPGAKIVLVVAPTANFSDLADIDLWIAENLDTGSVSHSFGFPEYLLGAYYGDTSDITYQYDVNAFANQVLGISNNYSTGDDGDYYTLDKSPVYDVSFPSGSPDATAVGGTALALTASGAYQWEEGWGNNAAQLNSFPPQIFGYQGGGGGGTSAYGTLAPAWQSTYLHNTYRQQPDVAFLADPYTGAEIIFSQNFTPGNPFYVTVIGGTSLACPMFSGAWSIVEQAAGTPYLGNAATLMYQENASSPGSFRDIVPVGSGHNAHGTVFNNGLPTAYSQWQLAAPYQNSLNFWEVIWNDTYAGNEYTLTFGTDSSLYTAPGWDNVTGIGTPNGWSFVAPYVPPVPE